MGATASEKAAKPDVFNRILWDPSGSAAACNAAAPTLPIHPCLSAPERNRKTEGKNGNVALALGMHGQGLSGLMYKILHGALCSAPQD